MMGSFVGTLFPLYALPVFLACGLMAAFVLRQVRLYLASEVDISRHSAVGAGIWLFAVVGLLIVMAPQSGITRTGMLLLCGFLLQLGVMDAVSGWLPRPCTAACLCAGLLFSATFSSEPVLRFMETAVMAVVMGAVCHHVNRHRPQLGVGDAWLLCAQVAWLGMVDVMTAAFLGLSGFMLWQWVAHRDFQRCGFLGPWLCVGCIPVIVERLYQPEWIL
ncbi:prepilin peptidase [Salmonella enterica]|nr:prepilin peptidase [Salmonella enterica]ELC3431046.1 prepilin peptidase [Salmonella enterica]EMB3956502.1 prepilin peptidase [Salmonella enterica]EMB3959654.1 prepilin peptidase [Salmonella enterica]